MPPIEISFICLKMPYAKEGLKELFGAISTSV